MIGPIQRQQPGLEADEGDGVRRAHRASQRLAGVRMDTARDVERQHRAGLCVDVVDQPRVVAFDGSRQADAEQPVHDQTPANVFGYLVVLLCRYSPEKLPIQQIRNNRGVTPVVAGAREYQHVLAPVREERSGELSGGGASALHERRRGACRRLLDAADVLGAVDRARHRQRSSSYLPPFSSARWYAGRAWIFCRKLHSFGRRSSRPPRAAAASSGKLIWMSAALNASPANQARCASSPSM